MSRANKRIESSYYTPKYQIFAEKGRFPAKLTLGYEQECCLEETYDEDDNCTNWDNVAKDIINDRDFLYAKEDGSVCDGGEINTHPFNFNWYRKNHIADYMDVLKKQGIRADDSCGFHVHIGRNFFTENHLVKMVKFFYANPKFISQLSQRDGSDGLLEYANPDITDKLDDGNYDPCDTCHKNCEHCRDEWKTNPPPPIDFNNRAFCRDFVRSRYDDAARWVALNLTNTATVEIRAFQGTVNKKLAQAYLEFVVACVLYTRKAAFKNISVEGFKRYVGKYKKVYPFLYRSGIMDGEAKRTYQCY